ncbi:Pro-FMRFamide-related neuropeptide FF, partial [Varanus komodoensis]
PRKQAISRRAPAGLKDPFRWIYPRNKRQSAPADDSTASARDRRGPSPLISGRRRRAPHRMPRLTNSYLCGHQSRPVAPRLWSRDIKALPGGGMRVGGVKSREVRRSAGLASVMDAARFLLTLALLSGGLGSGRGREEEGLGSKELLAEEPCAYPERLLDWLCLLSIACCPGHVLMGTWFYPQQQENEEHAAQSPPEEHPLGVLLRSLLHAVQRPGRSPSFLFQPQRFGRDTRASPSSGSRIIPRAWDLMAPQFLSMAAPQRFGKKK